MRLILFPIGVFIIRIKTKNFKEPIDKSYSAQDIVDEGAYFVLKVAGVFFIGFLIYKILIKLNIL